MISELIRRQEKEDKSGSLDIRQKEAEKDVAKKITELNEGTFIEPSKITLKDYLLEWLKVKEMEVDKSTYGGYECIVLKHLIPALGKTILIN